MTATPKDYLKNVEIKDQNDPREWERRVLLDTYKTFGCENGIPTYRYSLLDGVKEGHLINPIIVDARTDITAQMLADSGYVVAIPREEADEDEESKVDEQTFVRKDFEKTFSQMTPTAYFAKRIWKTHYAIRSAAKLARGLSFV